jgi:hypothetical protein
MVEGAASPHIYSPRMGDLLEKDPVYQSQIERPDGLGTHNFY